MNFKVEDSWSSQKYCRHHGWRTKKKLSSRRSRTAKTVKFRPCWQLFNSFCFETISFFLLFPFFPFCYARKWGPPPPPPFLPGFAGPEILRMLGMYLLSWFSSLKIHKWRYPYQAMSFFLSEYFFTNRRVYLFYKSHGNNSNKIKKIWKCSQKSMLWAILRR